MLFDRLNVLLLQGESANRVQVGVKLTTNAFIRAGSVTVSTIVQMVQMKTDVVCFKLGFELSDQTQRKLYIIIIMIID